MTITTTLLIFASSPVSLYACMANMLILKLLSIYIPNLIKGLYFLSRMTFHFLSYKYFKAVLNTKFCRCRKIAEMGLMLKPSLLQMGHCIKFYLDIVPSAFTRSLGPRTPGTFLAQLESCALLDFLLDQHLHTPVIRTIFHQKLNLCPLQASLLSGWTPRRFPFKLRPKYCITQEEPCTDLC